MSDTKESPVERLAIHATHEAAGKIAGIGAVLDGILPEERYRSVFPASLLVGAYPFPGGRHPLAEVLFDSHPPEEEPAGVSHGAREALRRVAAEFGTRIVVGRRPVGNRGRETKADVVLVSPDRMFRSHVDDFRNKVRKRFGFDAGWYESAYVACRPKPDTSLDRILEYYERVRREGPGVPEPPFLLPDSPLVDHRGAAFFGGVPYGEADGLRALFPPIESLDDFSGAPKTNPYLLEFEFYFFAGRPLWRAAAALIQHEYRARSATLFAHDWLGVPVFFAMKLDEEEGTPGVPWPIQSVYFAHEARIARMLAEGTIRDKAVYLATRCHPDGHDVSFYAYLAKLEARDPPLGLEAAFPELKGGEGWKPFDDIFQHSLNRRASRFDRIVAVGENVRRETELILRGDPGAPPVHLCPNGIPDSTVGGGDQDQSLEAKTRRQADARARILEFAQARFGFEPDVIFTTVSRCELSKAPWRNVAFFRRFLENTAGAGTKALFIWLSRPRPLPSPADVKRWAEWGWPLEHRPISAGGDLRPEETFLWEMIRALNESGGSRYRILYVNQYGWARPRLGALDPERTEFADLRLGTDVEIGLSVYEPFGIAPLEPFGSGAVCVVSDACGCALHLEGLQAKGLISDDGFVVGRFCRPEVDPASVGLSRLREIEEAVYAEMVPKVLAKLAKPRSERLAAAQAALKHLSWSAATEYLLRAIE